MPSRASLARRDTQRHGRGVGRALIEVLVEHVRSSDIRVLVAAVDAANEASVTFHQHLGFTEVARMPEVGRKFDGWLDLVLMKRVVDRSSTAGAHGGC